MGDKSIQKKTYIVEKARKVFIEKGYKNVTMKDIVEACDISRGGLYLYFESTKDIFKEVLKTESGKKDPEVMDKLPEAMNNTDILTLFFREQKKEILQLEDSLAVAIYEYCFECNKKEVQTVTARQMEQGSLFLEQLLEQGVKAKEFEIKDVAIMARNILYVLEGMKIVSRTAGITEKEVDRELVYLLEGILPKTEIR